METPIVEQIPQTVNPFDDSTWSSSTSEADSKAAQSTPQNNGGEPPTTTPAEVETGGVAPTPVVETNEVVDADDYLKTNLGYQSWDEAKKEIAELKKLKEAPLSGFKFENEKSQKLFEAFTKENGEEEIFNYLNQKRQLERVEKLDVNNANDASEIIKLNLRLKHTELSDGEISEMFDETYGKPSKPVQEFGEDDAEYELKLQGWKTRTDAIERKIIREGKMMRPEVLSFNEKIVLPNIKEVATINNEPSQEDLAAQKLFADNFLKSAKEAVASLSEYSAALKDKDVELTASYGFSQEEKAVIDSQIADFADKNFDANVIFAKRWLNADGSLNSQQMVKDLSLLQSGEKISQKLVSEAASKRLELYLKEKKRINVSDTTTRGGFIPDENGMTEQQKLQDWVWNA